MPCVAEAPVLLELDRPDETQPVLSPAEVLAAPRVVRTVLPRLLRDGDRLVLDVAADPA